MQDFTKAQLKITFIGHATVLIHLGSQTFITDPNFSSKVFRQGKRLQAFGMEPEELPPLDAVLVSRARHDYLDLPSYKFIKTTVPLIAPKGLGTYIKKFLPNPVTEIKSKRCYEQHGIKIHALPAAKGSWRLWPFRLKAATSYLLEALEGCVYFTSQSSYGDHFKKAGEQFKIKLALLPVDLRAASSTKPSGMLNFEQASQACEDLKAEAWIPIGWDAFRTARKKPEDLIKLLESKVEVEKLSRRVQILVPGESFSL